MRNHNTSEMMQTLTHKLKHNTIQMLYNTNKHKMNNLIKYTAEDHTGYVTEERKVLYKEVVGFRKSFGFFWTLGAFFLLYSDFIC